MVPKRWANGVPQGVMAVGHAAFGVMRFSSTMKWLLPAAIVLCAGGEGVIAGSPFTIFDAINEAVHSNPAVAWISSRVASRNGNESSTTSTRTAAEETEEHIRVTFAQN